jgi:hypothetical protein
LEAIVFTDRGAHRLGLFHVEHDFSYSRVRSGSKNLSRKPLKPSPHRSGKLPSNVTNHETEDYEEYPNGKRDAANEIAATLCIPKSRGAGDPHSYGFIRIKDKLVTAIAVGHRLAGTRLLVRISGDRDAILASEALLLEDSSGICVATQGQERIRSFHRIGRQSLETRRIGNQRASNTAHQRPSARSVVYQERFAVTLLGHRGPKLTSPSFSSPARASDHAAKTYAKPHHGPPAARRDERAIFAGHHDTVYTPCAVVNRVGYGRLWDREKPPCLHRFRSMPIHDDDARHEEQHADADQHHPEHLGWLSLVRLSSRTLR